MQNPPSLQTIFLDQPPSCLKFCPDDPDYFVIGTYLLSEIRNEQSDDIIQKKTGSLQLWHINPTSYDLSLKQNIPLPYAVFDLQFHPQKGTLLAIATSDGHVVHFRISRNSPSAEDPQSEDAAPSIQNLVKYTVHDDSSVPALFLAWTPEGFHRRETSERDGKRIDGYAVTFADGSTSIFSFSSSTMLGSQTFTSREMSEVWYVALATYRRVPTLLRSSTTSHGEGKEDTDPRAGQVVPFLFTGNDFGTLRTQRFASEEELDADNESDDTLRPVILDYEDRARHHTAGVTSILPLPIELQGDSPIILTGSYDEYLRVYHATRRGNVLAEKRLDGGVWRLQLLRDETEHSTASEKREDLTRRFTVLASCMHAGARVVKITCRQGLAGSSDSIDTAEWEIDVVAQFTEHESMNYASDVWNNDAPKFKGCQQSSLLCISSSFYDRRVCVWKVEM